MASPLKTFTVEEQSELIRKGKMGLFQRFADIGGAQKSPPRISSTTIFIYIPKTNFLQENKEAMRGSPFSVQRFRVMKIRVPKWS